MATVELEKTRSPRQPRREFMVRLPVELHRRLWGAAHRIGVSMNDLAMAGIDMAVEQIESATPEDVRKFWGAEDSLPRR